MTDQQKSRREFLGYGLGAVAAGGLIAGGARAATHEVTAPVGEGPFYPIHKQQDRDADLTRFDGRKERAAGQLTVVEGVVMDGDGKPLADALVDIWQANAAGRYHHERDPNPTPRDVNFQGWAQVLTDQDGKYSFLTVKPGAYPAAANWTRPPHIHFKVAKRGFHELTTQMFFDGEPLNDTDQLFLALSEDQRKSVVAVLGKEITKDGEEALHCGFDIVLKPA
ncbi:MAG: protocatechuate 3,4-dioxygenase [Proteobacteria bacterium]|nr:protocatechuate 3,4-dioxygenase [Pseudomonadota bacterium]